MGTELLRVARKHSKSLSTRASVTYWSLLSQLYHAHKTTCQISGLGPVIRSQDFDKALDLADSWSSQSYTTAYEHYVRNQFAYLIKKYVLPSRYNPEDNAIRKFKSAEYSCSITNDRFRSWCLDTDYGTSPTRIKYNVLLKRMRSFITYVLGGELPLDSILANVGFGPGASLGVSGRATNAMRKLMANELTVSPRAATYLAAAVSRNLWLRRKFSPDLDGHSSGLPDFWFKAINQTASYVRYNKIAFVPKTAKVLRTIAIEPSGNSLLQKGADLVMRQRLLRVGIDLSCQKRNQEFARLGSLSTGQIATIDLSSASDSVATEVVRSLFPDAWFAFLNAIRSETYVLNGEHHKYHKFSSMGNGTTFPIETLIFVAACHAVGCGVPGKDFTVYGDDIAIPVGKSRELLRLLRILGFRTNLDKTFVTGPFRESCGEDWFGGVSVRPFVFDYALDSVENIFKFLNQTRDRTLWVDFFEPVRDFVLRLLPVKLRFYRPFKGNVESAITSVGDEHLSCSYVKYLGMGTYSWTELTSKIREDSRYVQSKDSSSLKEPDHFVFWYGVHTLTSGINTITTRRLSRRKGTLFRDPWFSLRNCSITSVTKQSGSGADSNSLPRPVLSLDGRANSIFD